MGILSETCFAASLWSFNRVSQHLYILNIHM